ncbi:MAG: 5-formyltetrahydrofolate cyclo-ligase [Sulfuricella sp.]|nr:5-formyltetrahydrofolate cyclo-ligase [Sulfuricella sp.]
MNKRELRAVLRRARRKIAPAQRRHAADNLRRVAVTQGLLLKPGRIGFYSATAEEMDLLPLLNQALDLGKSCFLPVVPRRFQRRLGFSRLTPLPRWYLNRFGIDEHWSPRPVRAWQLDLLFVPLVGFDEACHRLGMGGGFYDASLAYLRRRTAWRKPLLVGVGYECQKVAQVPADPWDMHLDAVITERKIYWSNGHGDRRPES